MAAYAHSAVLDISSNPALRIALGVVTGQKFKHSWLSL
jgi:hypothetical protein